MRNKILLSGIAPGYSGTGRFLAALAPVAEKCGVHMIYPTKGERFIDEEYDQLAKISESQVTIMHPQTLGLGLVLELCASNNSLSMYVLDNSFFCIQSYNYRPGRFSECLDCLSNPDKCHPTCSPFPVEYQKSDNLTFLRLFQTFADKIRFFCQTEGQRKLLHLQFGDRINTTVIGMRTPEFELAKLPPIAGFPYDVVYHAEAVLAKGFEYTLGLARALPELRFLFPFARQDGVRLTSEAALPENAFFDAMRWETGLASHVGACRLVICPSLWSAPVEGALMKSLFYNGNVAVVQSEYGFEREIPPDLLIQLSTSFENSALQVRRFLIEGKSRLERARQWVNNYNQQVNLEKIFQ